MESGVPDRERPRRVALLAAVGTVVALLAFLLVYSFDLAHLDAEVVANRVRASGGLGPVSLMALLMLGVVGFRLIRSRRVRTDARQEPPHAGT